MGQRNVKYLLIIMITKKHKKIIEIEKEFCDSFENIVMGFLNDGESMTAIAEMIGYTDIGFFTLCKREGWSEKFKKLKNRSNGYMDKISTPSDKRVEHLRKISRNVSKHLKQRGFEYNGYFAPLGAHCDRLGISIEMVKSRMKRGDSKQKALSYAPIPKKQKKCASHPWKNSIV